MAGSGGGSITLRLGLEGASAVKAGLAELGPAGANALRQIEAAQNGPTAGMRALNAAGLELKGTMQGLAGHAGGLGSAISAIGVGGMVAAAGIGALIATGAKIAEMVVKTSEWSESLLRFAEATGQTTTAVQEWDFVAQATGIPIEQMRAGIEGIGKVVGQLQDNLARGKASPQVRLFEAILGTDSASDTGEKLRQLGDLQHILPVILDYAAKLSATQREGLSRALRIDPETLNAMVEARDKMGGLIDEAHRYGIIVDADVIKKSAEAGEKMHVAAAVMQGELRVAFANLAGPASFAANGILSVTVAIGDLVRGANDALGPVWKFIDALNHVPGAQAKGAAQHGAPGWLSQVAFAIGGAPLQGVVEGAHALLDRGAQDRMVQYALGRGVIGGTPGAPGGGVNLPALSGGGGRRTKDQGDEVAQHVAEMTAQAADDVLKAKKDELTALLASTKDEQQRAAIQAQINQIDDAQRDQEAAKREQANALWLQELEHRKGVTAAELKTAQAAVRTANAAEEEARLRESGVASQRDLNALQAKRADAEKAAAAAAKEALQAQIDLLKAQLPLVRTMQQRRDSELKIFDLEEQQRQNALRETIALSTSTPEQIATAQGQLSSLLATVGLRRQAVSNANPSGPWDQMLEKMQTQVPSLNQEFQDLASQGIEQVDEKLVTATGRFENLGQLSRQILQQMLVDLERYIMRAAMLGLFGNGQSGSGGGVVGSLIASIFGGSTSVGAATSVGATPFAHGGHAGYRVFEEQHGPWGGLHRRLAFRGLAGGGFPEGFVRGPGTSTSDSIGVYLSDREFVMNAMATSRFRPVLERMNATADGRRLAAGGAAGDWADAIMAGAEIHFHAAPVTIDAKGADPAQLQRVVSAQRDYARAEPQRFSAYFKAALRQKPGGR